jgi:hypothetical protein
MTDHYDVIVIGSGAGGGTLTHALAPTGTFSPCIRCATCDGYPCLVNGQAETYSADRHGARPESVTAHA